MTLLISAFVEDRELMEMEWRPLHRFCYHLLSRSTSAAQCFCTMREKSIGLKSKTFHPNPSQQGVQRMDLNPQDHFGLLTGPLHESVGHSFFGSALQRATWTSDTWYVFIHMHEIHLPHISIPSSHKQVFLKA